MAINLFFTNRNVNADGIRVYKSDTEFDESSLPPALDTLPGNAQSYIDSEVSRGERFYYMLEVYRGLDSDFTPLLSASALATLTGPGPNVLIGGDSKAGFYGGVPTSDLITGDALATYLGLTGGTSQNSGVNWLKFNLDGKVLFIPKLTLRHSISWDMLNTVNAVFGERTITIKDEVFKIRLLQGINPDESALSNAGYDLPFTHQSEWNRLIYPIVAENATYPKTSQVGPNWVTYTEAELGIIGTGNGRYTWCQETASNNTLYRASRGSPAAPRLSWDSSSTATTSFGWRPVLELVTD